VSALEMCLARIFKDLDWQTIARAAIDAKGFFAPLANHPPATIEAANGK
jgi:hypothetical protein